MVGADVSVWDVLRRYAPHDGRLPDGSGAAQQESLRYVCQQKLAAEARPCERVS
jgi:hypothetical protein